MATDPLAGLLKATQYPLLSAIFNRRSRRISKGVKSVPAGSLSYTSTQEPQALTPLEEALLIAITGVTGFTMHDVPFKTEDGKDITSAWMHTTRGRTASSPDNAQSTHFFMINDSGTYFLKTPSESGIDPHILSRGGLTAENLIAVAEKSKVKVLDKRLDAAPREFPAYFSSNEYVSNLPGTTIFVPVIDTTKQYINSLMQLIAQEHGGPRPTFIDDWKFYLSAGVKRQEKSGYLSKDQKLPLGLIGTMRMDVEAGLLLQNILLTIQAMGLGGWVHAALYPPLLLGDPDYARYGSGLNFRYEKPKRTLLRLLRIPITPLPAWRSNPVGLDGVLEGYCPPYYKNMSQAIDALIEAKYGKAGTYGNPANFEGVYKTPETMQRFLNEVPRYSPKVIATTKDICNYIWDTYGRFPAHCDAIHVPGVWVQAHHLDLHYYDSLYAHGYTETQAEHQRLWHGEE